MNFTIKIALSLLILCAGLSGLAQSDLDSLKRTADTRKQDTATVIACYEIAQATWHEDAPAARKYAEIGLSIARKLSWEPGLAYMHRSMGAIESVQGNYASALLHLNKALEHARNIGDDDIVGLVHNNLGAVYSDISLLDRSLKEYGLAEAIFEEQQDYEKLAMVYNNTGVVLDGMDELDSAKFYYDRALNISLELKDSSMLSFNYINIGYVYKNWKKYDSALLFFEKSKKINEVQGNMLGLANDYASIAEVLVETQRYSEASDMLERCIPVVEGQNVKPLKLDVYKFYSKAQEELGNPEVALAYSRKYEEVRDAIREEEHEQVMLEQQAREKNFEIALLNRENEIKEEALRSEMLKNNLLRIIAAALILSLIIALYQYWKRAQSNKLLESQKKSIEDQHSKIEKQNRELVAKNKKLDELNREKDYLVKVVAHDLASPLSRIKGLVELIMINAESLSAEQQSYLKKIDNSSDRLRSMIKNILDTQAIQNDRINIQLEDQSLDSLLDKVVKNYEVIAAEKNINIEKSISTNGATVKVDPALTQQVFENLLSNAVKFSPKNSNIRVRLTENGKLIRSEFIDQGPGLTEDDQVKLFKKFQKLTAKPTGKESSYGIGLSIVKKLVDAMNGKVYCKSSPGEGANFVVEFKKVS